MKKQIYKSDKDFRQCFINKTDPDLSIEIMKETFKQAGYTYIENLGNKTHKLQTNEGTFEVWFANKNHASYGLIYKNTHLEFAYSLT